MDKQTVPAAYLCGYLTNGFQKRLGFNITGGAADFRDDNIRIGLFAYGIDKRLDFIGDMGDNLYGFTQIIAFSLLVQYIPVHLAGGQVRELVQIFVNKTLIMSQVKVGFCTVIGDIYLAVLERAHSTRVNIDIRIQLLCGNFQSACLKQAAKGCCGNALAQTGNNPAGHKNILGHASTLPSNTVVAEPLRNTASSV